MLHSASNNDHMGKVRKLAKGAGYKTGGQNHSMKKIKTAVHKHEEHMHPGKKLTKLKDGGHAEGKHASKRLDKMARGGPKKGGHKVAVNVIVPQSKGGIAPPMMPAAGPPAAPRPPMPAPAPAAPVAGGAPAGGMMRPMKDGGKAAPHMDAGAGGGKGRLEKAKNEKKFLKGKAKGGSC